jgi:DNA-binding LytR/AlgR family response regulator
MNISCYIVDDEFHAIEILREFVLETPNLILNGFSANPVVALNEIQLMNPDIIFLDVDMPEISGLEFADLVKHTSLVVFTTSHSKYALTAFDKQVFDFLLKPITYERFIKCIHKARKDFIQKGAEKKGEPQFFYIKTDVKGKLNKVELDDILYVEADANYVHLHLKSHRQMAYLMISEVIAWLPSAEFSRIHKSYIVSHSAIKSLEPGQVTLKNGEKLEIGRSYKEEFHKKMSHLVLKSRRDT